MNNLKIGDRVILKANHPYDTGEANPCEGSEWFCEGEVRNTNSAWLSVNWDNRSRNTYEKRINCLELVGEMEVCI